MSKRTGARVNLQQQLTSRLMGNITANYISTQNQLQAFGEQNDYGIMGSLFFAPTYVDFRPVNGIYPLPPSLGTNPLLAIDRIRNPQTIDRFIGSSKLTWTPLTNLVVDYTIGIDNTGFEQRQFVPRNAVLGTAPLVTGRSQSILQATRVINQDGVAILFTDVVGSTEVLDRLELHLARKTLADDQQRGDAGERGEQQEGVRLQMDRPLRLRRHPLRVRAHRDLGLPPARQPAHRGAERGQVTLAPMQPHAEERLVSGPDRGAVLMPEGRCQIKVLGAEVLNVCVNRRREPLTYLRPERLFESR